MDVDGSGGIRWQGKVDRKCNEFVFSEVLMQIAICVLIFIYKL